MAREQVLVRRTGRTAVGEVAKRGRVEQRRRDALVDVRRIEQAR